MPKVEAYTYRIQCLPTGEYYYGVRYAAGCTVDDLWVTYFTHSKKVKTLRLTHGDGCWKFEIRKTFECIQDAIRWEERVNCHTTSWHNYLNENSAGAILPAACARGAKKSIEARNGIHGMSLKERKAVGAAGGRKTKDLGKGIHALSKEQKSKNGKRGLDTQRTEGLGFYGMSFEQHSALGKKFGGLGGKRTKENKTGIFNKESPDYYAWRKSAAKKGGIAMKGMKWWNNGIRNTRAITQPGPEWAPGQLRGK